MTATDRARAEAGARGWVLDLELSGHRVSDFPHAAPLIARPLAGPGWLARAAAT